MQESQFGLNWSSYSVSVGNIFGAPLAMEGLLAFFLESTFIGLWLFGGNRLPPLVHTIWICVAGDPSAREMITMMPTRAPAPVPPRPAGQVNDLLPLGDWVRHHSLRSWPVLLFLLLICVPSIALVILGPSPSASTFDHVAWIFAAYFAVAWLLLLGVIIRPEHVTRPMLVLVTVIALATQVPLAVTLEVDLHANTAGLGPSIYSVGLPEELAKAIPVLAVALIYRLFRQRP